MNLNTPPTETTKYHWLLIAYSFQRREVKGAGSFTNKVRDTGQSTNITQGYLDSMKKSARESCGLMNDELLDCFLLSVSFLGTMTVNEFNDVEACKEVS